MSYIYHRVPKDMKGTTLYPLNKLKDAYPELYNQYIQKYEGRMELLDNRIDRLDCLWNDVLHCSALNPSVITDVFKKLDRTFSLSYFEIPAEMLEPENTTVYLYNPRGKGTMPPSSDFIAYDPRDAEKYAYLPKATEEYYRETLESGGMPLMYHLVPHILYKGTIDTKDLKILST